jgi:hypothetical protein
MNGVGGKIGRIHRPFGIGTSEPSNREGEVIFTDKSVKGGEEVFRNLAEGDPVKYRLYPGEIAGRKFAEDVWPE